MKVNILTYSECAFWKIIGKIDSVRELIKEGDINIADRDGKTALILAAEQGNPMNTQQVNKCSFHKFNLFLQVAKRSLIY